MRLYPEMLQNGHRGSSASPNRQVSGTCAIEGDRDAGPAREEVLDRFGLALVSVGDRVARPKADMDAKVEHTADEDDQVFEQIGLRLSILVDRPARANQNGL
jgi:hypothetical protein